MKISGYVPQACPSGSTKSGATGCYNACLWFVHWKSWGRKASPGWGFTVILSLGLIANSISKFIGKLQNKFHRMALPSLFRRRELKITDQRRLSNHSLVNNENAETVLVLFCSATLSSTLSKRSPRTKQERSAGARSVARFARSWSKILTLQCV